MKILMVTTAMELGGAETHILTLAEGLEKAGHHVSIASSNGKMLENSSISHITLPFHSRTPGSMHLAIAKLKKMAKDFDIVHAHTRYTALLCKKAKIHPLVVTAHWVFSLRFPLRYLSTWGDATLAVSEDIKKYLINAYHLPKENIFLTMNGIDTDLFKPKEKKPFTIVHVSRLDTGRAKCAFLLLAVFPYIKNLYPEATLTIIGDGNCKDEVFSIAKDLNKKIGEEAVVCTGAKYNVAEYLSSASIFVGVSRAALEAMSCGCEVILCGDEGYGGIFNTQDAQYHKASNFCCRDDEDASEEKLKQDLRMLIDKKSEASMQTSEENRRYIERSSSVKEMAYDAELAYQSVLPKQAILCGYYHQGNIGDDLSLMALIRSLSSQGYEDIRVLSKKTLPQIFFNLRPGTLFVLGSGNLLQNETSMRSLYYYASLIRYAKKKGCLCEIHSAGIGNIYGNRAKKLCQKTLLLADKVYMRTLRDAEIAAEIAPQLSERLHISHDMVLEQKLDSLRGNYVVFALRPLPRAYKKHTKAFINQIALLVRSLERIGYHSYFVAMHPSHDMRFSSIACNKIGSGKVIVPSKEDFLALVAGAACCIGMRLHLSVVATSAGVPSFLFPYDNKMKAFAEDINSQVEDIHPVCILPFDFDDSWQENILGCVKVDSMKNKIKEAANRLRLRSIPWDRR